VLYFSFDYPESAQPGIIYAILKPGQILGFFAGFIGSVGKSFSVSLVVGLVLLFLFFRRANAWYEQCPMIFWILVFIMLTALAAAIGRQNLPMKESVSSRYTPYSLLFMSLVYLGYVHNAESSHARDRIMKICLCMASFVWIYWLWVGVGRLADRHHSLDINEIVHPNPGHAISLLEKSKIFGVFNPN
jgi:surface polysaccharide O-acyltransferase-like enzyme